MLKGLKGAGLGFPTRRSSSFAIASRMFVLMLVFMLVLHFALLFLVLAVVMRWLLLLLLLQFVRRSLGEDVG